MDVTFPLHARRGDKEHLDIVSLYASGLGYTKLFEKLGWSTKSLRDHIYKYNDAVKRSGFCVVCLRAGGEYQDEVVSRR